MNDGDRPGDLRAWDREDLARLARAAGILWTDGHSDNLTEDQVGLLRDASNGYLMTRPKNTYFVLVSADPDDLRESEVITMAAPDAWTAAGRAFTASGHLGWHVVCIMDADGGDYTDTPLLANVSGPKLRRIYQAMGRLAGGGLRDV